MRIFQKYNAVNSDHLIGLAAHLQGHSGGAPTLLHKLDLFLRVINGKTFKIKIKDDSSIKISAPRILAAWLESTSRNRKRKQQT